MHLDIAAAWHSHDSLFGPSPSASQMVELGLSLLYIVHQVGSFPVKHGVHNSTSASASLMQEPLLYQLLSCKRAVVNAWLPTSFLYTSKIRFLPLQNALKVFPDFPPVVMDMVRRTDPSSVTQHGLYTRDLSHIHIDAKQPHSEASGTTHHS